MTAGISAAEERFEEFRQRAGLWLAPLLFAVLWFLPLRGLSPAAHHLLAIMALVVTLWITEALPLPVTALLGPALAVLCGVGTAKEVFRSFGDPIVFLFLGSFLLAEAIITHGLNRRIAFSILSLRALASSPGRLLLGFALITGFISMWVSNTATTAMMFPIAQAILTELAARRAAERGATADVKSLPLATGLMLLTAFAASIGGYGTPVGTPPNLIGIGMINKNLHVQISFFQWMAFCLPLTIVLLLFLAVYLTRMFGRGDLFPENIASWLGSERAKLGALTRAQKNVWLAFGTTVFLWIAPGVAGLIMGSDSKAFTWMNTHLPESTVALLGGLLLFVLPVNFSERRFTLTWEQATRIDWGTILLFGGGLALGELMFNTGLASWLGEGLAHTFQARTNFGVIALFTLVAILISEATSNTASATMIVPVAIAVAQAAGTNPMQAALAATLGASMGFMLPVSTPPNAIVYGSGYVGIRQMVKAGVLLDVAGFIVIVAIVQWLVPLVVK
jgi:sodium-dependent dicarboxylate transporter 2/3/5